MPFADVFYYACDGRAAFYDMPRGHQGFVSFTAGLAGNLGAAARLQCSFASKKWMHVPPCTSPGDMKHCCITSVQCIWIGVYRFVLTAARRIGRGIDQ